MSNATLVVLASENDDSQIPVGWIVLPIILGFMLYSSFVCMAWPYARVSPLPFWLLFLAILVPPLFPFLLLYLFFVFWIFAYPTVSVVAVPVRTVARPAARPVIATSTKPLRVDPTIRGGSRV